MLLRDPFTKALRDTRRSVLWWAVAIAAVAAMYAAFWPSFGGSPQLMEALKNYPQGVLEAMNYTDMTSAAGYLGSTVYGLLVPLLVIVFAIIAGTRAVAGDEEAGTLDLILAHPVSRTRLALRRFAAVVVGVLLVATAVWLALVALIGPARLDGVSPADIAAITLQLALLGVAFAALAFAIGAASGSRGVALGTSAAVAVWAFLANGVLPQVEELKWTRSASPWHWYLGGDPLINGVQVGRSLLLFGMTAVLVAAGTVAFNRRDIAV